MTLFIHTPITDSESASRVLAEARREDGHLDFKAVFWKDNKDKGRLAPEEAANDVAAFLNHLGGTILVGIGENQSDGRANGWCPNFKMKGTRSKLLDWLKTHLVPEVAIDAVRVWEIPVKDGREQRDLLAVNIEPWRHGPVAVLIGKDRESYRFPIRRDRETRFLPWEEIMVRNDAARRGTYLKLLALSEPEKRVLITSPMKVRMLGKEAALVAVPQDGHGWLRQTATPDHAILHLDCHSVADEFGRTLLAEAHPQVQKIADEVPDGLKLLIGLFAARAQPQKRPEKPLSIPFELISAVWADVTLKNTVNISLKATVLWDGGRWSLETR